MCLFADMADIPDIYKNWEESFGDTKEEIDTFFEAFGEDVRVCVIRKDGVVAAQLCLLPAKVKGKEASYLYAVATNRAYRKKGLCTQLLTEVSLLLKKEGKSGILVPANAALQAFYKKRGFTEYYKAKKIFLHSGEKSCSEIKECTVEHYIALRQQAFADRNSIEFADRILMYALGGYLQNGYCLAKLLWQKKEYGILYREKETIFIQEITVFDNEEAQNAGEAFLAGIGKREAWLQRSYLTMGIYLPEEIRGDGYFNLVLD